ncbi:TetR/AcrR family transcriptional regulator [Streptomonospora litoralis]|uniref:DNA-binding transcriptional repressor FabR n=1 Tax=Streptomonospora litoralis TaxID=2498135 RepID=A0A4P6PVZ0_9ACTN|nr:TetR/AcrR family transcriptional regulator [Streptomonospora litoralis]QBI52245.1 DNA-binding transcriptional repressor FabR [Streptomonospora litoralis]
MSGEPKGRPLRADARRNRERILQAAMAELTERPPEKQLSLDAVARRAGVGPGTLYRHFPTWEALIVTLYDQELERLCASAPDLLAELPPERALRTWMGNYADFVATKRGMGTALHGLITSDAVSSIDTRGRLTDAVGRLLDAGREAGLLRTDVSADDIVAAMSGALLSAAGEHPRDQVDRLLDLLLDGLRASPAD